MTLSQLLRLKSQRTYFYNIDFNPNDLQINQQLLNILKTFPYCVQQQILPPQPSTTQNQTDILNFNSELPIIDPILLDTLLDKIPQISTLLQLQNFCKTIHLSPPHIQDLKYTKFAEKLLNLTNNLNITRKISLLLQIPFQLFETISQASPHFYLIINYFIANSSHQNTSFQLPKIPFSDEEKQLISHIFYGIFKQTGSKSAGLKSVIFYNNTDPKLNFISFFEIQQMKKMPFHEEALSLIQTENAQFQTDLVFEFLPGNDVKIEFLVKIIDCFWINSYFWGQNEEFVRVFVRIFQRLLEVENAEFGEFGGDLYDAVGRVLRASGVKYKEVFNSNLEKIKEVCDVKDLLGKSIPIFSQIILQDFNIENFEMLIKISLKFMNLTDLQLPAMNYLFKNRYRDAMMDRDLEGQETTFQSLSLLLNSKFFGDSEFDQFEKLMTLKQQFLILQNGSEYLSVIFDFRFREYFQQILENYLELVQDLEFISIDDQKAVLFSMFLIQKTEQAVNMYKKFKQYLREDLKSLIELYVEKDIKAEHQIFNLEKKSQMLHFQVSIVTVPLSDLSSLFE